ncbi:hypothetical protein AVHY2522_22180 [Acidovorax sp. SUPP2522]|uniref:hypothetical protein n=1 Tax=Acidovorax sp. SUPP2522 TaxID=511900 RepID=UPI0023DE3D60|nr:hypothetical protein [Acidovorax sp. SUPP2522]WCM99382.1 hypothetical protein M5C96_08200 [Acidovorax sp. GBBC 1281]GKT19354.1 hypothetical protein AVHY2522_22180 [Acidovorax sp. SUPP2522]
MSIILTLHWGANVGAKEAIMTTTAQHAAQKKVEGGFGTWISWANDRQERFTQLLIAADPLLKEFGVSFPDRGDAGRLDRIEMTSHLGPITLDFVKVMEADGELTSAVVFSDIPVWRGGNERRHLFTAVLGASGNWAGTDGVPLYSSHGQFAPATALDAVRRALAAKLALDTVALTQIGEVGGN